MNAEEYEWIGIVHPVDVKPEITCITPLAYYDDGDWKAIPLDARRQWFPNSGRAGTGATGRRKPRESNLAPY